MIVLRTSHHINATVSDALCAGLGVDAISPDKWDRKTPVIGYGILRGCGDVFNHCERMGIPWFNVDNGYFKPGHFDGYYRISFRGTQQRFDRRWAKNGNRFNQLGIELLPMRNDGNSVLVVPPTEAVADFFGFSVSRWVSATIQSLKYNNNKHIVVRHKTEATPLDQQLNDAYQVVTFNSGVGWEALRRGIRVVSSKYSTIGTADGVDRADIFKFMANNQLTLEQIAKGDITWITDRYISDGTAVKA